VLREVLIAEFKLPTRIPVRLYRVLDDDQVWFDYEQEAAGGHAENTLGIMRKHIRDAIYDKHLVSGFVLKAWYEERWAPWNAFAIINDTASVAPVEGNRVTNVLDFTLAGFDREFVDSVIFWVLFDLCGMDADEDIFSRMLFELQIPTPVTDDELMAWTSSDAYIELQKAIEMWSSAPPTTYEERESQIDALVDAGEEVFDAVPSTAATYDHHVAHPMKDGNEYPDGIEWAVSFDGVEQYVVTLFLFAEDDEGNFQPATPEWGIASEGLSSRDYSGDHSDLLTAFVGSRILIPASQYEAWMDAHIATPTQVFTELDLEPWRLLGTRVPWLWSADDARPFFSALERA